MRQKASPHGILCKVLLCSIIDLSYFLGMEAEPHKEIVPNQPTQSVTSTSTVVAIPAKRSLGPWRVLGDRNYALLFWGQLISNAGTQMQVVAVAWQVYLLTHSAVALGLIGLMQAIPRILFSLFGGVLADMLDRRKILITVNVTMMSFSLILALGTNFQFLNVPVIYLLILSGAMVSTLEFPTRLAIVPALVPREQMADALSLNSVMMQLTTIIGPTLGGVMIGWLGLANTYWFDVFTYVIVVGSLF